jgi:hypothetical protein
MSPLRGRNLMRFIAYAIPGLISLVGIAITANGLMVLYRARMSATWWPTKGQITHCEIVTRTRSPGSSGGPRYAPEVRYSYQAAGKNYDGSRISMGGEGATSEIEIARRYTKRYPVGHAVTVYYDPNKPSSAVLEPGVLKRTFVPLCFGLGFAAFAAWFVLLFWLASD